jgi:hypothetical protein
MRNSSQKSSQCLGARVIVQLLLLRQNIGLAVLKHRLNEIVPSICRFHFKMLLCGLAFIERSSIFTCCGSASIATHTNARTQVIAIPFQRRFWGRCNDSDSFETHNNIFSTHRTYASSYESDERFD